MEISAQDFSKNSASDKSLAEIWSEQDGEEKRKIISTFTEEECEELYFLWEFWSRPSQRLPPGTEWTYWLCRAGRGWGKTRVGAETVRAWVKDYPLVNLVGPTSSSVRDVMIEGPSGILAICPNAERPKYEPAKHKLTWPNGATSLLYSADEPARLRGPQHYKLWCLTGDTQVSMADGSSKRLDNVRVGDEVQTREGAKKVLASVLTKRRAEVFRLEVLGGRSIVGTAEHPVYIDGKGFVPLGKLEAGMKCAILALPGTEKYGTEKRTDTICEPFDFTGRFGRRNADLFQRDSRFITETTIRAITKSAISNFFLSRNTRVSERLRNSLLITLKLAGEASRLVAREVGNVRKIAFSAASFVKRITGVELNTLPRFALSVAGTASALTDSKGRSGSVNIALNPIRQRLDFNSTVLEGVTDTRPERETLLSRFVKSFVSAEFRSRVREVIGSSAHESARVLLVPVVSIERCQIPSDVYDIAVEGEREFFANGILVHNCDEIAAWRYAEAWEQAQLGLRLGKSPQAVITSTPKPIAIIRELSKDPGTILTTGTTYDNRANLAPKFFENVISKYEGTRLGRQELNAEVLEDNPNALFKRADIDKGRVTPNEVPDLVRIVIPIDPAVTSNEDSCETGIVPVGMDRRNPPHFYVLEDASGLFSPKEWAEAAVEAYENHDADRIIGEVNNGGDLVEANIRSVDKNASYEAVRASRGKTVRAEPIGSLYEQGRVHHVGSLAVLEDQMTNFNPNDPAEILIDRMEAMVWGIAYLSRRKGRKPLAGFVDTDERPEKRLERTFRAVG